LALIFWIIKFGLLTGKAGWYADGSKLPLRMFFATGLLKCKLVCENRRLAEKLKTKINTFFIITTL